MAITPEGETAIEAAAPRHVETVRRLVFDALAPKQVTLLAEVSVGMLAQLDAD